MSEISVHELKARLSRAIAEAEAGQTLVITRHRTPVAQLVQPAWRWCGGAVVWAEGDWCRP